jgi:hypothetical protein
MSKKLFALASVSALGGLVSATSSSGCSSTEVITVQSDAARDVVSDRRIGDQEEPDIDTCMLGAGRETEQLDHTEVAYKSPAVTAGACSEQAIKDIETFIGTQPSVLFADLKAELVKKAGDACAKCVFAAETDKWAPIVEDASGKVIDVNLGGCIELVSGSAACGKAYQQFDTCTTFGCSECTVTAEKAQCQKDIVSPGGPCEAAGDDLIGACTNKIVDYVGECYPAGSLLIAGPIRKQCITGSTIVDGGNDG